MGTQGSHEDHAGPAVGVTSVTPAAPDAVPAHIAPDPDPSAAPDRGPVTGRTRPRKRRKKPEERAEEAIERDTAAEPAATEVLIVQDDAMFAEMLEYALRATGRVARALVEVGEARTAIERLAAGKRGPGPGPVVVLDPTTRGLGSLDLMSRFGRFGSGVLQFVALSSEASENAQILAFESGATDYVVKPAPLPVLLTRIDCLLRGGSGAPDARDDP